jgi:hypothetical protein
METSEAAPTESISMRLARIAAHPPAAGEAEVLFLLDLLAEAGDQRVVGLREAAGLIRAAKQREVTTRFLVGKKEQVSRSMNSKLMDTVANLIDKYAADAAAGRV